MTPSYEEALALHGRYGSGSVLVKHCVTVASVASVIAGAFERSGVSLDRGAVTAGALLHDIGRNRTHTVAHGVEGAAILEKEGVDAKVVEIVRRHVGAGLSKEEAKKLGLPEFDYVPRSLEERIVCFADKMVGSDLVRPFKEEVDRYARKGHDVKKLVALKEGIRKELGQDPERLVLDNIKESQ